MGATAKIFERRICAAASFEMPAAGELSMLFKVVSEIVHPLTRQPLTPIEAISHPLRREMLFTSMRENSTRSHVIRVI